MKLPTLALCAVFTLFAASPGVRDALWFNSPANEFTQALPLGNGRLGAMVFGGTTEERILLNESSLWSGGPQDADRADAAVQHAVARLPRKEGHEGFRGPCRGHRVSCAVVGRRTV